MPKPRIILFFAIAAGLGQIVRISNVIEIVDWGRPGSKAWCFCMGSLMPCCQGSASWSLFWPWLFTNVLPMDPLCMALPRCCVCWGHYSWMVLPRCLFQFLCHRIKRDDISRVRVFIWKAAVFYFACHVHRLRSSLIAFVLSKTAAFGRLRRAARVLAELWSGIRKAKHLQRYIWRLSSFLALRLNVSQNFSDFNHKTRGTKRKPFKQKAHHFNKLSKLVDDCTGESKQDGRFNMTPRLGVCLDRVFHKPQTPGVEIVVEIVVMEPMMAAFCTLDHPCSVQIYLIPWSVADLRYCYLMSPDCYCYACEAAPIKNHLIIRSCLFKFSVDLLFCSSVDFQFCSSVDSLSCPKRWGLLWVLWCRMHSMLPMHELFRRLHRRGVGSKIGRFTEWEWMKLKEI